MPSKKFQIYIFIVHPLKTVLDHPELFIRCSSDQSSALPPALALTALPHHPDNSAPPHRTEAPWGDASQQMHTPAASASHITTIARTDGTVHSGTAQLLTSSALAVASSQHTDAPTTTTVLPGDPSPSGINIRRPLSFIKNLSLLKDGNICGQVLYHFTVCSARCRFPE